MLRQLFNRSSHEKKAAPLPRKTGLGRGIGSGQKPIAPKMDWRGSVRALVSRGYYIVAATLLAIACLLAIENMATVLAWHVPVPFSDEWDGFPHMIALQDAGFPLERVVPYLWSQHNEHRIVVPKTIHLLDMTFFGYRGYFPIVCIFLFQAMVVGALTWLFAGRRGSSWEILLLVALLVLAAFDLVQWENFASTFQTSFVGCFAFAVVTFVLYAKYTTTRRTLYLWCTVLFAVLASLSLASGLFVWIVLALLAYSIHPRRYTQSLSFAGAFLVLALLYLHRYTSPGHHANPVDSVLHHPLSVLNYLAVWLGNIAGTVSSARLLGSIGLLVLLVVGATLALDRNRNRRIEICTLLAVCLFVLMSGTVISLGRINFGVDQAMSSRYVTPVLIFWVSMSGCLLLLALELVRPLDVGIVTGLILASFVGLIIRNDQAAAALNSFQNQQAQAYLAVVTGRYKDQPESLLPVFPVPAQIVNIVDLLKTRRISSFNATDASPLKIGDKFLPSPTQRTDACKGYIDGVTAIGTELFFATGWAWDADASAYPDWIFLVQGGNVIGLGKPGIHRPDVAAAVPSVNRMRVGWQGIARGSGSIARDNIEAYISTRSGRYCRI